MSAGSSRAPTTRRTFPDQQPVDGTRIPRLSDLFDLVKKSGNTKVGFDCETKVSPLRSRGHPAAGGVRAQGDRGNPQGGMAERTMVQSFDWSTLQVMQKEAPEIRTMYLSSPRTLSPPADGPSPWLAGFDAGATAAPCRRPSRRPAEGSGRPTRPFSRRRCWPRRVSLGIIVIPWTVNDPAMMAKLLDMGVDGIISDRPDLVQAELKRRKK